MTRKQEISSGMAVFERIVTNSYDFDNAFYIAQNIRYVPPIVADWFRKKYDPDEKLTPKQAFKKYYDDVKDSLTK